MLLYSFVVLVLHILLGVELRAFAFQKALGWFGLFGFPFLCVFYVRLLGPYDRMPMLLGMNSIHLDRQISWIMSDGIMFPRSAIFAMFYY